MGFHELVRGICGFAFSEKRPAPGKLEFFFHARLGEDFGAPCLVVRGEVNSEHG